MLRLFKRDAEDPEVEDPEVEDPEVEDPEVEDPEVEDPEVEDPEVEDPEVEDPEVEDPEVEDPEVEDPEVEDPEVEDLAATLDATRRRLFKQLVAADGRVNDPETIEYAPELVDDPAALAARITAELEARPGIGRHAAGGDIGAGITGDPGPADLIDAIRAAHQSDY